GAALQLGLLGLVWLWLWHRAGGATLGLSQRPSWRSLLYGPWSLVTGGVALALLNTLTLLLAGRPWGVTWGFTLWSAKLATLLGWNPTSSGFWRQASILVVLQGSVFADVTSVMNVGIVLGAALAAAIAGQLTVRQPPSRRAILAALVGGLLMGYGAWLAFGCNVGAYFSGIASTSLHGWLWIAFALLGTTLGVRLRPLFQLTN
ncbi:YeeE/YedE family protein, partial [filamentous cyanobacterium CCT1]